MTVWETIFLGIVQGIAEFLPISSSGHLIILQEILKSDVETLELNIALHLGTLFSILVVYRRDLPRLATNGRLLAAIFVATLPVVIVGLFFIDQIKAICSEPIWVGIFLCVTAILLWFSKRVEHGERNLSEIRLQDALIIGLFQAIAPLPGISRSGSTIFGGLLTGLHREAAASFSFYIAIPAIAGAAVMLAKDLIMQGGSGTSATALVAGSIVSFVVGLLALKILLRMVRNQKLAIFAVYCLTVGIGTILWQLAATAS